MIPSVLVSCWWLTIQQILAEPKKYQVFNVQDQYAYEKPRSITVLCLLLVANITATVKLLHYDRGMESETT